MCVCVCVCPKSICSHLRVTQTHMICPDTASTTLTLCLCVPVPAYSCLHACCLHFFDTAPPTLGTMSTVVSTVASAARHTLSHTLGRTFVRTAFTSARNSWTVRAVRYGCFFLLPQRERERERETHTQTHRQTHTHLSSFPNSCMRFLFLFFVCLFVFACVCVPGGSLDLHGVIQESVLAVITRSVLQGLSYLSKVKVLHRDVKPSNILVSKLGHVKLCDFGLSHRRAKSNVLVCVCVCVCEVRELPRGQLLQCQAETPRLQGHT